MFAQPFIDQAACTPDPGVNGDCRDRTIFLTGAAFHTRVALVNSGFPFLKKKDLVWTDFETTPTTDTKSIIELQGRHIL